jgi:hypothetical protein
MSTVTYLLDWFDEIRLPKIFPLDPLTPSFRDEPLVVKMPVKSARRFAREKWPRRPANAPRPVSPPPPPPPPPPRVPQASSMKVECCICLTTTDVARMATYVPCGHCVVCSDCFENQRLRDVAAERETFCPKCRALVTSTLKVFL